MEIDESKHLHSCLRCIRPFQCFGDCESKYCERCIEDKKAKGLREMIESYPEMSEEEAKLLFIRKSAMEAYEKGDLEIKEATKDILVEITKTATIGNMTNDQIGLHIGNLEKARSFLAAFTQGLMIGHKNEVEPAILEKHKKEAEAKTRSKISKSDAKVNDLVEMAKKLSLDVPTEFKPNIQNKVTCEKCQKEVWSLKFHKC